MLLPQKEHMCGGGICKVRPVVCLAKGDPVPATLVPTSEFTYGDKYLGAEHSHESSFESSKEGKDVPLVTRWVPDRQEKPLRVAGSWGCFPPQRKNFPSEPTPSHLRLNFRYFPPGTQSKLGVTFSPLHWKTSRLLQASLAS